MEKTITNMRDLARCFARAMNLVSPKIANHHEQVAYLSWRVAGEMNYSEEDKLGVIYGALMHDIGAVILPELEEGEEEYDEFIFNVNEVEEKYFLSDKVKKYVLSPGTKNFKTSTKTDLDVARPLLQSMHKMHRAGVDNYVTNKGRIRKLTPRECLRLMGFKDWFKIDVADTAMYQEAGNSIVVDVLIAILKQMDITKYGIDKD